MRSSIIIGVAVAAVSSTVSADFAIWRVTNLQNICTDGHCKAEPSGYNIRQAVSGDCKNISGDAKDLKGSGATNTGDGFVFEKSICGSVDGHKCTKNDDGSYDCGGPNGEQKAHCTGMPDDKSRPMFTCKINGGNDAYNQVLHCATGDLKC